MDAAVRFELTRACANGLANRCLRPLGYTATKTGEGARHRTANLWFWRPTLYLLSYTLEKIGAVSRNRTHHASAFNAALYQLSYHGKNGAPCRD
jgi:hypothetical protein